MGDFHWSFSVGWSRNLLGKNEYSGKFLIQNVHYETLILFPQNLGKKKVKVHWLYLRLVTVRVSVSVSEVWPKFLLRRGLSLKGEFLSSPKPPGLSPSGVRQEVLERSVLSNNNNNIYIIQASGRQINCSLTTMNLVKTINYSCKQEY